MPAGQSSRTIDLNTDYPAKFLPFDLLRIIHRSERTLAGRQPDYRSERYKRAMHLVSDPFDTYQTFHFLSRQNGSLADKFASVNKALEIGSGLGQVSFILAQFLNKAILHGVEIDEKLIEQADMNKRALERLGYDLSRANFFQDNILALDRAKLGEYDLVIGFFPLSGDMDNFQLIGTLQALRPGTLVCQLLSDVPLPLSGSDSLGFRRLRTGERLPYYFFERL